MSVHVIDLRAYLERIGLPEVPSVSHEGLLRLHEAQVTSIRFEMSQLQLGEPRRLDVPSLEERLVRGKLGGTCFQLTTLFSHVLTQLGFTVTMLGARVRGGEAKKMAVRAKTHVALRVDVEGTAYLVDVGFGSVLGPIPLVDNQEVQHGAWRYRLLREGELWVLQEFKQGAFADAYAFTLEPYFEIDLEMMNHFNATHPLSSVAGVFLAQKLTRTERLILRNAEFKRIGEDGVPHNRTMQTNAELLRVLRDDFDLEFPEGTRFPAVPLP